MLDIKISRYLNGFYHVFYSRKGASLHTFTFHTPEEIDQLINALIKFRQNEEITACKKGNVE